MCALLGIDSSMSRSTHDYIMLEAIKFEQDTS